MKHIFGAIFVLAALFTAAFAASISAEKTPALEVLSVPIKYRVSLYCFDDGNIKYAVREAGKYVLQDAQWKWKNGEIVDYVEARGAWYLPEAMLAKGYERNTWSYTSWRDRLDVLPVGVFFRGCDVLEAQS